MTSQFILLLGNLRNDRKKKTLKKNLLELFESYIQIDVKSVVIKDDEKSGLSAAVIEVYSSNDANEAMSMLGSWSKRTRLGYPFGRLVGGGKLIIDTRYKSVPKVSTAPVNSNRPVQIVSKQPPSTSTGVKTDEATPRDIVSEQATPSDIISDEATVKTLNITGEDKIFFRLSSLVTNIAPCALRKLLDTNLSPSKLQQVLSDRNVKEKLGKHINKGQWNILYPDGDVITEDFDVTLLAVLLRVICGIAFPKSEPDPMDHSEAADIARIKFYRNKICHQSNTSITDKEFNDIWTDLKQAIIRVGAEDFRPDIDELYGCSFDRSYKDLYKQLNDLMQEHRLLPTPHELERQQQHIKELKDQNAEFRDKFQDLEKELEKVKAKKKSKVCSVM